jgi:hypothetical protein
MLHELKIWPQYFDAVMTGRKNFEVRKNDRGFQAGDVVILREWDPTIVSKRTMQGTPVEDIEQLPRGYTGASVEYRIGYVLPIDAERVVFSLLASDDTRETP